jgi:hypothetical protein
MLSKQGRRHRRRSRRARRRGSMHPAIATQLSTRTRLKGWAALMTKSITRHHRREKYWEDYHKIERWN